MTKVSVIIPCFNTGHYLAKAIQSVLDQTYQDFEIIVVDDGSTDNTQGVVQTFNDPRLKYIYQENKGLPGARNIGIRASSGEYIALLDADDALMPYTLSTQVEILERDPHIGLVAGGCVQVDGEGKVVKTDTPWKHTPRLDTLTMLHACPFVPSTVCLRRKWVVMVGLFDEHQKRVEDWDLWVRLIVAGCRMEWNKQILITYLLHQGNISRDAKLMGEYALRVLDKLYSRSDLPDEVFAVKDSAYATKYMVKAGRLYVSGEYPEAKVDVMRAVELNPKLLEGEPAAVIKHICDWADHPFIEDKFRFLANVEANFPQIIPDIKRHFRKAIANAYIATAFKTHEDGDSKNVLRALLNGISRDLSWLNNRGIWSIGVKALLTDSWLDHWIRRKSLGKRI